MKEAIKVQSVTIIIINGISESFQSVRWVMQKTEAILAAGGGRGRVGRGRGRQLSAGEQPGRGCVWPPGQWGGLLQQRKGREKWTWDRRCGGAHHPGWGMQGGLQRCLPFRGKERSAPHHNSSWTSKPSALWLLGFSCRGIYSRACRRLLPTRHSTNNGWALP